MATQQPSRTWPILRNLGLLGAVSVLALLNWQIWTTPKDIRPIAFDSAAPSIPEKSGEFPSTRPSATSSKIYTETLARPMFRADRKPFVAKVDPPPPVMAEEAEIAPSAPAMQLPEGLSLVGVMRDNNGQDRALVKSAQSPSASWLQIGDEIDGWRVSAITPSAVTLSADASSITLELYPVAKNQSEATEP